LFATGALLGGEARAAKPPTKAQLFQAYLKKMRPAAGELLAAEGFVDAAEAELEIYGATQDQSTLNEAVDSIRVARNALIQARSVVRSVRPPGGFGEPHNGVSNALLEEASAAKTFMNALSSGRDPTIPQIYFDGAHDDAKDGYKQWRVEATTELRRFGLVVPRWVKEFGT
jgi:hypothetical protein